MLRPMLDGLENIDWTSLAHAYGPAVDVPKMIRAMASDDPSVRNGAFFAAYGNIWHQGTVYSATAAAVPFLLELAAAPKLADRNRVLELLFHIAHGSSYLDVHQHLGAVGETLKDQPAFDEALTDELGWVQASAAAVAAGRPVYLDLLYDDAAEVRREAARMLTCCPDHRAEIVPALKRAFESDDDAGARATALYAVAVLAAADEADLVRAGLDHQEPLIRLSAALCSAFYLGGPPSPLATDVLVYFLEHPAGVAYEGLAFGGDCATDVGAALARVEGPRRPEVAERLLAVAENGQAAPVTLAEPLLQLTFDGPRDEIDARALTTLQKRALTFVSRNAWSRHDDGEWSVYSNFTDLLEEYGLEEVGRRTAGFDT